MHNRQGLSVKMIWVVIKDWRMWPLYILGLTHMSMLDLCCLIRTCVDNPSFSPGDSTTDLLNSFVASARLQYHGVESAQYTFDRPWHGHALDFLLPERDHQQPCHRHRHSTILGSASFDRAVYLQCRDIQLGVFRGCFTHHRISICASSASSLGLNEFVWRRD